MNLLAGLQSIDRVAFEATVTPPEHYAGDWGAVVEDLVTNDARIIDELRTQYRADGGFRRPLHVWGDGELLDGCHRYVAAVCEGATEFEIYCDTGAGFPREPGLLAVEVFMMVPDFAVDGISDDAWWGGVSDLVRSFPVGDDWVDAVGVITEPGEVQMGVAWGLFHCPDELSGAAVVAMADRLNEAGVAAIAEERAIDEYDAWVDRLLGLPDVAVEEL